MRYFGPVLSLFAMLAKLVLILFGLVGCGGTAPAPEPLPPEVLVDPVPTEITPLTVEEFRKLQDELRKLDNREQLERINQEIQRIRDEMNKRPEPPAPQPQPQPEPDVEEALVDFGREVRLLALFGNGCSVCVGCERWEFPRLARSGWSSGIGSDKHIQVFHQHVETDDVWFTKYAVTAVPTFVLIDREREVGRLEWQGETSRQLTDKAVALFNRYVTAKQAQPP